MAKRLNGSAQTGKKILDNINMFTYEFDRVNSQDGEYFFDWHFEQQFGKILIKYKNNIIDDSSYIDTSNDSRYPFERPLGKYNDPSLDNLFWIMLDEVKKAYDC